MSNQEIWGEGALAELNAAIDRHWFPSRLAGVVIPEWVCCICGKDADYKYGKKTYCAVHWNYGQPISRETKTEVTAQEEVTHGK